MTDNKKEKGGMCKRDASVRPYVNIIAKPLAKVDLCEKLFKAVKKGKSSSSRTFRVISIALSLDLLTIRSKHTHTVRMKYVQLQKTSFFVEVSRRW
jgi:hypothetical protein